MFIQFRSFNFETLICSFVYFNVITQCETSVVECEFHFYTSPHLRQSGSTSKAKDLEIYTKQENERDRMRICAGIVRRYWFIVAHFFLGQSVRILVRHVVSRFFKLLTKQA